MDIIICVDYIFMIAVKYALFALISTIFNLSFQYLSLLIYSGSARLYLAMFAGTSSGLISKYILDKNYIFYHENENKTQDIKTFILYTFTGGFTTIIFWGAEIGFDAFFGNESAKYIGATIGLGIGYILKYLLDKRYVFKKRYL